MEENQDLTIGADGLMKEGLTKANAQSSPEKNPPDVNKLIPPPESKLETPADKETVTPASQEPQTDTVKSPPNDFDSDDALNQDSSEGQIVVEQPLEVNDSKIQTPPEAPELNEALTSAMITEQTKPEKAAENRNNKKLIAVVTILVAFALAGGAIYIYISTQKNTAEATNEIISQGANKDNPQEAEIEQAREKVDEAVEAAEDEAGLNNQPVNEESKTDEQVNL